MLLGVAGALIGGFVSCIDLQSVWEQRTDHNRFERLANSDVVEQERKILQAPPDFIPEPPPGAKLNQPGTVRFDESTSVPIPSQVNRGGIATINWSHDYGVESIETSDGQALFPTPAPSAWDYLWIPLFTLLGFFVPWGAIRAIGWVVAGFVKSST